MKLSKASLLLANLCAALCAVPANASNTGGYGQISGVFGTSSGAVLFSVSGPGRSGIPSCGTSNPTRWALDASTVAGQAQVAVFLSAWAAHKQVAVVGTGSCSIWGDTETVLYVNIQD